MLLSGAFVKLLRIWDQNLIGELPRDLVSEKIPIMLFQIGIQTLQKQLLDGSWRFNAASRETTAYAILRLKSLYSLPWFAYFQPHTRAAIRRGSEYLVNSRDRWDHHEHIWVAKATYALPLLAKSYIIAALCAGIFQAWSVKVSALVSVPEARVKKLASFFASLPMFHEDELWILEGDVVFGYLYHPQLLRLGSRIFPKLENAENHYLEYIPFTWIATNRKNHHPLSNMILSEMMTISLIVYQLDEFMETTFGKHTKLETFTQARQIIQELCELNVRELEGDRESTSDRHSGKLQKHSIIWFADSEEANDNPNIHGSSDLSLDHFKATLSRFTSYIFQHPAVIQSPSHIRKQLHRGFAQCMLAHVQHEEDNSCFAAHQKEHGFGNVDLLKIVPFESAQETYYSWVHATSADDTQSPSIFLLFSCLAAARGEAFFVGARQSYLSNALGRHLASLCRQYNDYGSITRDQAEGNLNSMNFPEFHESSNVNGEPPDENDMKSSLLCIADYEQECLNHTTAKLSKEIGGDKRGDWKMNALSVFIETVNLYGQIYVARDISNRIP